MRGDKTLNICAYANKKYIIIFSYCKRALRILKSISVKFIANVLQHLFLATFYNLLLTISFYGAAAILSLNIFLDSFQNILRRRNTKFLKRKCLQSFSEKLIFWGFSIILRIIWNVCMQKKSPDPTKNTQTPPLVLFCSHSHERCGMYWNEWKIHFTMYTIFNFEILSFLYSKWINLSINFEYKIYHNSINKYRKN